AGKDWDWVNVNLANNYGTVATGKPIYKGQWNNQLHVSKFELLPLPKRRLVIGMDFGLTPSAIIGQETVRGQLRILEELVAEDMGVRQFAENVLIPTLNQKYKGLDYIIIGDPAGDQRADTDETSVFDELRDLGLKCEGSPDTSNSSKRRWEAVRFYLNRLIDGKPAFLLSPTCKVLRKGFNGGYQFRRMQVAGSPRYSKKADKNKWSHPHDALQYLCLYLRGDIESDDKPKATVKAERSY
ncbi:MAG: TerL, partial [Desulfofustis sp.]|nr:TerL [Desulfofustis sp.]